MSTMAVFRYSSDHFKEPAESMSEVEPYDRLCATFESLEYDWYTPSTKVQYDLVGKTIRFSFLRDMAVRNPDFIDDYYYDI